MITSREVEAICEELNAESVKISFSREEGAPPVEKEGFSRVFVEFSPGEYSVCLDSEYRSTVGVPFRVYHNRAFRFYSPYGVDLSLLSDAVEELTAEFLKLASWYSEELDHNCNYKGSFGEHAEKAKEIMQKIDDHIKALDSEWSVQLVCEFMSEGEIKHELKSKKTISRIVREIKSDAKKAKIVLLGDVEECVRHIKQNM